MKYRKKPMIIEAKHLTIDNCDTIKKWLNENKCYFELHIKKYTCLNSYKGIIEKKEIEYLDISTSQGTITANQGDYIIQGIKGEFYPCRQDIFEETYEMI